MPRYQTLTHNNATHRLVHLIYLLAACTCFYAFCTLRLTPNGLLNLATWLLVSGIAAGSTLLARSSHQRWQAACIWMAQRGVRLPVLLLAGGLGLVTAIRFSLRLTIGGDFFGSTVVLWSCTCVTLIVAMWPQAVITRWRTIVRTERQEVLWLLLALVVAAAFRFYHLGTLPNAINGDEGLIGIWALDTGVASGILTTPFASMDGVGTNYLYVMKGVFQLLGSSPFTLRLLPAIAGMFAIPVNYICARALLGRRAAWIATVLLIVSHVHIHFSRTVAVSYIYATLFVPLGLYLLLTGLERRSVFRLVLAALTVGLHMTIYVDSWAWLVLHGILVVGWIVVDRKLMRDNVFNLVIWLLALAIFISPMVIWSVHFPGEFSSRLAADGTFASGWLDREVARTGRSPISILLELMFYAVTTFSHQPFGDFYNVGVPTLDVISRGFWAIGLLLSLLRTWDRRFLLLNGWFWGGVVALGIVTVPPSTYSYRMLVVLPAACMFVGLAVDSLLKLVERGRLLPQPLQRPILAGIVAIVLAGMAVFNLSTYFDRFANGCSYVSPEARQANMLGTYLGSLPHATQALVLADENRHGFFYGPHRSVDFLSGRKAVRTIFEPLSTISPQELTPTPDQGLVIVAVKDRKSDLQQMTTWLPGGSYRILSDCGNQKLYLYQWFPTTGP